MRTKQLGDLIAELLPCDPDVKLPADVRATIARGDAAFKTRRHTFSAATVEHQGSSRQSQIRTFRAAGTLTSPPASNHRRESVGNHR